MTNTTTIITTKPTIVIPNTTIIIIKDIEFLKKFNGDAWSAFGAPAESLTERLWLVEMGERKTGNRLQFPPSWAASHYRMGPSMDQIPREVGLRVRRRRKD